MATRKCPRPIDEALACGWIPEPQFIGKGLYCMHQPYNSDGWEWLALPRCPGCGHEQAEFEAAARKFLMQVANSYDHSLD